VRLSVFHQRRADADIVTLKRVLDAGELGAVWRFHSSFDLDEPGSLDAGPHGGLLRDLGSHLVDQAVWLFGPAVRVSAEVDWVDLPVGRTDGGFVVTVEHAAGPVSFLSASKLNRLVQRSLAVYAEGGSYIATGSDVQTGAIKAGRRPKDDPDGWGYEPEVHWGRLSTAMGKRVVPSAQGNHARYYTAFAKAVATGGPVPVPVRDAVEVLRVLDAARTSALEHRVVGLSR
jgi:predicted dehydrogenase